jgi:membrane-anchored protein YejM (alkaline phosphatase superfamily)
VSYLFNYAQTFASRFALLRYFGFVWATSLTHDGLNMAALADEPLSTTIDTLRSRGDLKNTVLVILSDHGVRTGPFRLLPQVMPISAK